MAQDTEWTPVLFRVSDGEVAAVFPTLPGTNDWTTMTCYAHMGQHGSCSVGWYHTTRKARPDEYASLRRELESEPFGYRLKIMSRMTQAHGAGRRRELR